MLLKLLNEIRTRGTQDPKALAAHLGTTPEMVSALIEHLQRSGHLRPYMACQSGCDGCSLQSDCSAKGETNAPRLWALVEEQPQ